MRLVTADRKTLIVERRMARFSSELIRIDHRFIAPELHRSTLVTGEQWIFATVKTGRGKVTFLSDSGPVVASRLFAMFLPPRSVVRIEFQQCLVDSMGFLSQAPIPKATSRGACVFSLAEERLPKTLLEIETLVAGAGEIIDIGVNGVASSVARQAKETLDDCDNAFSEVLSITRLASKLGISREALSRAFVKAYGLSPLQYRIHTRIMNAVMRLARGEAILNVALDVGFQDLSRFYKQFGRIAAATPKVYSFLTSQNAKTD